MDVLKYCDSGGQIPSNGINSRRQEPSMTDIVHSMRDYLLTPTPDCLDPLDLSDQHSTPEARQCDKQNIERSEFTTEKDLTADNSHLDNLSRRNSLFSANGDATDDEVEVDITSDHPRLQGEFYQQLRRKYPRVFLRRCSVSSDAESTVSSVVNYRPAYRDSDVESNVSGYSRSSRRDVTKIRHNDVRNVNSRRASDSDVLSPRLVDSEGTNGLNSGLPPRPPSRMSRTNVKVHNEQSQAIPHHGYTRRRLMSTDSEFSDDDGLSDSASIVSARSYNRKMMQRHSKPPPAPAARPAGILKNSRPPPPGGLYRSDSTESIQDKLKRNQESIDYLFSDENSPFRTKRIGASPNGLPSDLENRVKVKLKDRSPTPYQLQSAKNLQLHLNAQNSRIPSEHFHNMHDPSRSRKDLRPNGYEHDSRDNYMTNYANEYVNDYVNEYANDYVVTERPITPKVKSKPPPFHKPNKPPMPPKPAKLRQLPHQMNSNLISASSKSGMIPKHINTRFSSPDSQHDSAVDLETSSQQSSPSSGSQSNGRMSRSEFKGEGHGAARPRSRTPKLGRYKSEEKLASITDNESTVGLDSDQDSGIVQNSLKQEVIAGRGRIPRDSESSSLDTDPEVDPKRSKAFPPRPPSASKTARVISPRSRVNSQGHGRSQVKGQGDRNAPIRADHYIQPTSPRSHYESSTSEGETDHWSPRHFHSHTPPRKAVSVADLSGRSRNSPAPKVRFEDEVYKISPSRRTMSYPELHEIESDDHIRAMNGYLLPTNHMQRNSNIFLSQSQEVLYENAIKERTYTPEAFNIAHIPSPRAVFNDNKLSLSSPILPPEDFQDPSNSPRSIVEYDDAISLTSQMSRISHKSLNLSVQDDIDFSSQIYNELNASLQKKSKKPWKRNKASFEPSTSENKPSQNKVKGQKTNQGSSLKPPSGKQKKQIQNGKDYRTNIDHHEEHYYEEMPIERRHSVDANDVYSPVKKTKNPHKKYEVSSNNCTVHDFDDAITELEGPPLPARGYESDLEKYRDLSGSKSFLAEKVAGLRDSARKRIRQFRRAVSLDRLDTVGKDSDTASVKSQIFKRTPSIRSIAERLSFRSKKKGGSTGADKYDQAIADSEHVVFAKSDSTQISEPVTDPTHFRSIGRLKQLNPDGTQILELTKPPRGPFGFYIARGNVKYNYGVFVSRLSDGLPESFFSGLLSVGDEILEVNNRPLQNIPLNTVYDWIAESDPLILKVLPYLMRAET